MTRLLKIYIFYYPKTFFNSSVHPLVTSSKHGVRFWRELALGPDASVLAGDLGRLLEGDAEGLGAHRRGARLQVSVGFAHLLDLVLAFDVAAERCLEVFVGIKVEAYLVFLS